MSEKIKVGMRVSTRKHGAGTIIRANAGEGWIVKFDLDTWNGPVYDYQIWDEAGEFHSEDW